MLESKYKDSDEKLDLLEFTKPPIYVTKNSFDSYQTGCIYFCENSIIHLKYQNLNNFLGPWMRKSRLMFLTVRNYIFNRFQCDNYKHLMLFSSIVLYILGQRAINDLDMIIYQDFKNFDKSHQDAINSLCQFPFIDYSAKGTAKWKHHWHEWLTEWANHAHLENFDEVLYNPDNHFYYFGVKIISIDVDISRRILRNRPAAIADLYMLKENLLIDLKIPYLPKKYNKYVSIDDENKQQYIDDGYKEDKGELVKSFKTDKDVFLDTTLKYLIHRYKNDGLENSNDLEKLLYPTIKLKIKIKSKKST
jgi:hypothetical protein